METVNKLNNNNHTIPYSFTNLNNKYSSLHLGHPVYRLQTKCTKNSPLANEIKKKMKNITYFDVSRNDSEQIQKMYFHLHFDLIEYLILL